MKYCMSFYLNWHRNYAWSLLELLYLLNKKHNSKFKHPYFLCPLTVPDFKPPIYGVMEYKGLEHAGTFM